jgi:type VI secretion system protein ImpH
MGAKSGRHGASLREKLFERVSRFQFFQAVRLLRKLRSERAAIGRDYDPEREMVRFRSDISYAFPTGDVRSLEPGEDGAPDEMVVNFLGIATPNSFGSLPIPYVEELRHQERNKNRAFRDFLDLFNHRLVSFFYRAWERSRMDVLYEVGEPSPYEAALRAILGVEGDTLLRRLPFDGRQLLARAGLLSMHPAPAGAIEGVIESFFGVPARVEQFTPTWHTIDEGDRTRLGSVNSALGIDMTVGAEVCLAQSRFRIRMGPMDFESYQLLLPESDEFNSLASIVRLAAGPELEFQFTLVLDKSEVPSLRLGEAPPGEGSKRCLLGWSTWIKTEEFAEDADDGVFTPSLALEEARDSMEMRA